MPLRLYQKEKLDYVKRRLNFRHQPARMPEWVLPIAPECFQRRRLRDRQKCQTGGRIVGNAVESTQGQGFCVAVQKDHADPAIVARVGAGMIDIVVRRYVGVGIRQIDVGFIDFRLRQAAGPMPSIRYACWAGDW